MATFSWLNAVSADWTTAADWNGGGSYPDAATASATIGVAGSYSVSIAAGESISVGAVTLSAAGATLAVAGTLQGATVLLAGGTLAVGGGTLDGVTLRGSFDLGDGVPIPIVGGYQQSGTTYVRDGLTAEAINTAPFGTLNVDAGMLAFLDSETLDNAAVAVGSTDDPVLGVIAENQALGTLTFGAGLDVTTIGQAQFSGAAGSSLVNLGSITAGFNQSLHIGSLTVSTNFSNAGLLTVGQGSTSDSSGHEVVSFTGSFSNTGTVSIDSGGRLVLLASSGFTNTGTVLIASGGSLEIDGNGGVFTLAQLDAMAAAFPRVGGTVDMVGTWELGGGTLDTTDFGNVTVIGTIAGGTILASGGFSTTGTLDGVSVLGTLRGAAVVEGGLTVAGIAPDTTGSIDLSAGDLTVLDSETLDNVAILLGDHTLREANGGTLTLGPGVVLTVAGSGAALIDGSALGGTVVSQGVIDANTHALTISPAAFTNAGTLSAGSGGSVSFTGTEQASNPVINTGTIIGTGGIFNASFSFNAIDPFTNDGLLRAAAGTVLLNAEVTVASRDPLNPGFITSSNMTNLSGGTLTGGTLEADGNATLQLVVGETIGVDAADIVLGGVGSAIVATQSLENTLASIDVAGTLAVLGGRGYSSTLAFTDSGLLQLGGGDFASQGLTLAASGRVLGFGSLEGGTVNAGTIEASGGLLTLGTLSGAGALGVDAHATLELTGGNPASVGFNGIGGTLQLDVPAAGGFTLAGFGPNDTLALHNTAASSATIDGDTLVVTLEAGGTLSFALTGLLANTGPAVREDAFGNADITLGGTLPPPNALWVNTAGGDWNTPADWNTGSVPDAITADPTIAVAGSYTVAISGGESIAIDSLLLNQVGATLAVAGLLHPATTLALAAGTLALDGGTIQGGSIVSRGGALVLAGGTLDGVSVLGTLDLASTTGTLAVRDGLTVQTQAGAVEGSIAIGGGSLAVLDGTVLNNLAIGLGAVASAGTLSGAPAGTLTLGSQTALTATGSADIAAGSVANDGTILIAAAVLSLSASGQLQNVGTISGAGTLALPNSALSNVGLLQAVGGTLTVMQTGIYGYDALTNYESSVLTGGSYAAAAGATLDLQLGGNIVTDAATIGLDGPGAAIQTYVGSYHPLQSTLASIDTSGTLAVLGDASYLTALGIGDAGMLELAGGTLGTGGLAVSAAGRLVGFGTVTGGLADAGTIEAQGGLLNLASLSGTGALQVDSGGTLELPGATGDNVTFNFAGGTLVLNAPAGFTGTLTGFAPEDTLVLRGVTASTVELAGNTLEVTLAGGGTLDYAIADIQANAGVTFEPDLAGGTDISVLQTGTSFACFAEGTRLLTAYGEVPVEALRVGDLVPTLLGRRLARVRWIGHRHVACRQHPRHENVMPVLIRRGAFAEAVPRRDLLLSPDHAVFVSGDEAGAGDVLIPVRYLVNGRSIARIDVTAVTYWHVELDTHDVLLAEGLPAESYLDTGNRDAFVEGDGATAKTPRRAMALHPDFALAIWQREACAPLAVSGAAVVAARRSLLARALAQGEAITADPDLRLVIGPLVVRPAIDGAIRRFALPAGVGEVRLASRVMVPAELLAEGTDTRRLGVAVVELRLDGCIVAPGDGRRGRGWHAREDSWQWTDGDAVLDCTSMRALELTLQPEMPRYWASEALSPKAIPAMPAAIR
jgi:hypothetical protein